jgi:hypothetical protein
LFGGRVAASLPRFTATRLARPGLTVGLILTIMSNRTPPTCGVLTGEQCDWAGFPDAHGQWVIMSNEGAFQA